MPLCLFVCCSSAGTVQTSPPPRSVSSAGTRRWSLSTPPPTSSSSSSTQTSLGPASLSSATTVSSCRRRRRAVRGLSVLSHHAASLLLGATKASLLVLSYRTKSAVFRCCLPFKPGLVLSLAALISGPLCGISQRRRPFPLANLLYCRSAVSVRRSLCPESPR